MFAGETVEARAAEEAVGSDIGGSAERRDGPVIESFAEGFVVGVVKGKVDSFAFIGTTSLLGGEMAKKG